MARPICSAIVLLFLFVVGISGHVSIQDYILLIADIHRFYRTSCIMFVNSQNHNDFQINTLKHAWSQEFSRHRIITLSLTFADLPISTELYQSKIIRPLFVVILTTKDSMEEFAEATKLLDISFPVWFLIFMHYPGDPLKDFCLRPTGNVFNLIFSTEMLVLCYDQPKLKEWYALRDNQTRVFSLATWKPGQDVAFSSDKSLYARRSNMFGETLRISTVEESPFVSVKDDTLTEFFGGIILELAKSINFKVKPLTPVPAYGSWNEESQAWTGVIGQLVTDVADFGCSEFTMTNLRLDVVDFTLPLMLSRNRLYFKRPDGSAVQWSGYFKTFDIDIWATISILILTTPILLTMLKTRGRINSRVLMTNYVHVWGIFCQQGLSELPKESPLRIAFLSIFVSALIVYSAYSASLISYLTVSSASLPFTNIDEFVADGSYKLIVFRNSADYDMFINATDGVAFQLQKLIKEKQDLPLTLTEGFKQVCSEKVAFYVTEVIQDAINIYLPCEVVFLEAAKIDSLALTMSKGNPYRGLINYHLQRFKDNGVLNKLKNMYLVTGNPPEVSYAPVEWLGISPILAILAGGTILGFFIFVTEKMYYYYAHEKIDEQSSEFIEKLDGISPTKFQSAKRSKKKDLKCLRKASNKSNAELVYWP